MSFYVYFRIILYVVLVLVLQLRSSRCDSRMMVWWYRPNNTFWLTSFCCFLLRVSWMCNNKIPPLSLMFPVFPVFIASYIPFVCAVNVGWFFFFVFFFKKADTNFVQSDRQTQNIINSFKYFFLFQFYQRYNLVEQFVILCSTVAFYWQDLNFSCKE